MPNNNTQLLDANGTRLTIERRPNDIRLRLEEKGGHEILFYATPALALRIAEMCAQREAGEPVEEK